MLMLLLSQTNTVEKRREEEGKKKRSGEKGKEEEDRKLIRERKGTESSREKETIRQGSTKNYGWKSGPIVIKISCSWCNFKAINHRPTPLLTNFNSTVGYTTTTYKKGQENGCGDEASPSTLLDFPLYHCFLDDTCFLFLGEIVQIVVPRQLETEPK